MRILITGVGNVGKSTLREEVAASYGDNIIQVDMDYYQGPLPPKGEKIVLVEDVHGLEKPSEYYDVVLYLKPMRGHFIRWLRRGKAWFSSGIVDIADRGGNGRPYSLANIPLILRIVLRNLLHYRQWVRDDLHVLQEKFKERYWVADEVEEGKEILLKFLSNSVVSSD